MRLDLEHLGDRVKHIDRSRINLALEITVPGTIALAEFLPDIDIAVSIEPLEFLERMAVIAEQSGRIAVERRYDPLGNSKLDVVNLRLLGSGSDSEFGGQLIARDDRPGRVLVEMRAGWGPGRPTRATYCASATELILPLLKVYNRDYAARHRLRVQKTGRRGYKLSAQTKTLFERFAVLANTSSLHKLDWDRFYAFVRESRQELPEPEVEAMLIEHGFSKQSAGRLADIYVHLWAFKRARW